MTESTERPAWTPNDLNAFQHRFITSRAGRRIQLENYYVVSQGESYCNQQVPAEER